MRYRLWNQAVKLSLPIAAVIVFAVTGPSPVECGGLALFGCGVATVMVWMVFRSERGAHALGPTC